jgi:hypothetical protein
MMIQQHILKYALSISKLKDATFFARKTPLSFVGRFGAKERLCAPIQRCDS